MHGPGFGSYNWQLLLSQPLMAMLKKFCQPDLHQVNACLVLVLTVITEPATCGDVEEVLPTSAPELVPLLSDVLGSKQRLQTPFWC